VVRHNAGMCGRFALFTPPARMAKYFQATLGNEVDPEQRPSWNVAPTTTVLGVEAHRTEGSEDLTRTIDSFKWGLVPSWAKDASTGNRLFNARGETVTTKPSFRSAFKARRLIVPADGFYEWHRQSDGSKQPHYFTRSDGEPFGFAGLYERWWDKEAPDAPPLTSCTIITTEAGPDMDGIHDRMPVILNPDTFDIWLDPDIEETSELTALLRPAPDGTVAHRPVDGRVGNVRNNDAGLINPVDS
jgi:putative SOS response-associated peptidase YedK